MLALALIVLMAFAALAVDIGMVSADRRSAQSVADAAALAGGQAAAMRLSGSTMGSLSASSPAVLAAINLANSAAVSQSVANNYTITINAAENGVSTTFGQDTSHGYKDQFLDIKVSLTTQTKTSFAHLFFGGDIKNTVQAIVRVRPRQPFAAGMAILALNHNGSPLVFDGTAGSTNVYGGGIMSNAEINFNGNVTVVVDPPEMGIHYIGSDPGAPASVNPHPSPATDPIEVQSPDAPDCSSLGANRGSVSSGVIDPGNYTSFNVGTKDILTLNPGLYCLSNGISNHGTIIGTGVTLYFTGGGVHLQGQAAMRISAPTTEALPAIKGLLIYLAPGNTDQVDLQGGSDSTFGGTVYVPSGHIDIGGNSSVGPTYNTQLIANTVTKHGNVAININYDSGWMNGNLARLDVYR